MSSSHVRGDRVERPRSLRAAASAVLSIVVCLLVLPAAPATAATRTVFADKSAWFWMSNSKVITCTGEVGGQDSVCHSQSAIVPIQGGTEQTGQTGTSNNPISLGHVGVSLRENAPDMRGYLHFDTSMIPAGSAISKYIVELKVSSPSDRPHVDRHQQIKERPPATIGDAAAIKACAVKEFWVNSEGDPPETLIYHRPRPENDDDGDDESRVERQKNEPAFDPGMCSFGEQSKDGTRWTFDITSIAKRWSTLEISDEGIALIPDADSVNRTWTVEFHGAEATKTEGDDEITTVRRSEAARATVEYVASAAPPLTGGGGLTPPSAFDPGGSVSPGFTGEVPTGETGTGTTTPPPASTPNTGGLVPVGGTGQVEWWLYVGLPLFIMLFGLVSTAIGPDDTPLLMGAQNRVASVLRGRRLEGAQGLAAQTEAIAAEEEAALNG